MAFSAIASVVGGLLSSNAAGDAADAQAAAAAQDLAFQKETRDLIFERLDPFYQPGILAQNALAFELGLGDRPMIGGTPLTVEAIRGGGGAGGAGGAGVAGGGGGPGANIIGRLSDPIGMRNAYDRQVLDRSGRPVNNFGGGGRANNVTGFRVGDRTFATREEAEAFARANPTGATAYRGFQATPGYQFAFDQGTAAVNALAGAKGGLNSGRTMQDLNTFGQGIANQEYANYFQRLYGMAQGGQAAAGAQANAATNAASGVSNALAGQGNAVAAGAIGQGNAWTGALNNLTALNQYQRGVNGSGGTGAFGLPRPF